MKTNTAPKLPRFVAPKRMTSVKFMNKKEKAMSRQKLNQITKWI